MQSAMSHGRKYSSQDAIVATAWHHITHIDLVKYRRASSFRASRYSVFLLGSNMLIIFLRSSRSRWLWCGYSIGMKSSLLDLRLYARKRCQVVASSVKRKPVGFVQSAECASSPTLVLLLAQTVVTALRSARCDSLITIGTWAGFCVESNSCLAATVAQTCPINPPMDDSGFFVNASVQPPAGSTHRIREYVTKHSIV
jgi:hypothetical protein